MVDVNSLQCRERQQVDRLACSSTSWQFSMHEFAQSPIKLFHIFSNSAVFIMHTNHELSEIRSGVGVGEGGIEEIKE